MFHVIIENVRATKKRRERRERKERQEVKEEKEKRKYGLSFPLLKLFKWLSWQCG